MKRFLLLCGIVLVVLLGMNSFRSKEESSIRGRVNPVDGATSAWAIGGRDSATSNIVNGAFNFSLKPGIYKVVVDAIEPYKDAILENIGVKEGQTIDVGEIILQRTLLQKR
ncbi:MAG TPA: carboxypeptidase-like regulatory domain-containing protein [Chitinophagaceae bacterium]|nr:carboxypeptidase-like regulatory domain-containing protein [Chitinophagaceae bacterium]